jgi:hypothetical protein
VSTVKLGSVATVTYFADFFSGGERARALAGYENRVEGEPPELKPELAENYASCCRRALATALAQLQSAFATLEIDQPFGYADHADECLRLGCSVWIDRAEHPGAYRLLVQPAALASLTAGLEAAADQFCRESLPRPLFQGVKCSFHLQPHPEVD